MGWYAVYIFIRSPNQLVTGYDYFVFQSFPLAVSVPARCYRCCLPPHRARNRRLCILPHRISLLAFCSKWPHICGPLELEDLLSLNQGTPLERQMNRGRKLILRKNIATRRLPRLLPRSLDGDGQTNQNWPYQVRRSVHRCAMSVFRGELTVNRIMMSDSVISGRHKRIILANIHSVVNLGVSCGFSSLTARLGEKATRAAAITRTKSWSKHAELLDS